MPKVEVYFGDEAASVQNNTAKDRDIEVTIISINAPTHAYVKTGNLEQKYAAPPISGPHLFTVTKGGGWLSIVCGEGKYKNSRCIIEYELKWQ